MDCKMEINAVNLWKKVLEKMEKEYDVNAYSTFFMPIIPKEIIENKLILEAPTRFVKEVINSDSFKYKINNYLKEITNTDFEIEVKEKYELENKKNTNDKVIKIVSNLNLEFQFSNFVTGPSNKECYEASLAVAVSPGKLFNPLFIYGRAGIGKTHLLHAIGNYCKENHGNEMNIYYTTANDFIDEFIRSSNNKDVDTMKVKFKSIDMLLLDDVQFLAGKDKTGEIFFQIFSTLFNEKKQIILTSDRNPNDLKGLEDRLVSRFASGLTVGMKAPECETAKEILRRKISSKNFDLKNIDEEVITFIAENYSNDVRQLEGALTRLLFYVTTINKTEHIDIDIAKESLNNITPPKKGNTNISAQDIKDAVCDYYNITNDQLIGSSKVATLTLPRFIAIYLCRSMLNMTFDDIGLEFNRDHSTIMNACIKIEKKKNEESAYKLVIDKISQLLTK